MAERAATTVIPDTSSDRDDDGAGGGVEGLYGGGGGGGNIAYEKSAPRVGDGALEVAFGVGDDVSAHKTATFSTLPLRQTVVPYDARCPATCIYLRTAVGGIGVSKGDLEKRGFVDDVMYVLLAASMRGRAARFGFDFTAPRSLTLLLSGLGDTSGFDDTDDAIVERIEPAFIVGHPWFTSAWRRRHARVESAWQQLRAAIGAARARAGDGASGGGGGGGGSDDYDGVATAWRKLFARNSSLNDKRRGRSDDAGADADRRRHLEWLLTALENSIVGFSVVYAPDAERQQALFTTSLLPDVDGDGPLSSVSLEDAGLFLNAIRHFAEKANDDDEQYVEHLVRVLRPVASAYATYVNMARRAGNTCSDVADVLSMSDVESPVYARLRLETLYRQFRIFGGPGTHLIEGYGAVTTGSFGTPKPGSENYRKQTHLELTRSARL
jgi:hypothetical protein